MLWAQKFVDVWFSPYHRVLNSSKVGYKNGTQKTCPGSDQRKSETFCNGCNFLPDHQIFICISSFFFFYTHPRLCLNTIKSYDTTNITGAVDKASFKWEEKIVFAYVVEWHFKFKNMAELRIKQEIKLQVFLWAVVGEHKHVTVDLESYQAPKTDAIDILHFIQYFIVVQKHVIFFNISSGWHVFVFLALYSSNRRKWACEPVWQVRPYND